MFKEVFILFFVLLRVIAVQSQTNSTYNLMPVPRELKTSDERFEITNLFRVSITGSAGESAYAEASRFVRRLSDRTGIFLDKQEFVTKSYLNKKAALLININRPAKLALGENEKYTLTITDEQIRLNAETDLGAIHGLETLLQLISTSEKGYYFPGLTINDEPRFKWRGLLLDVALHFMPINVLKKKY